MGSEAVTIEDETTAVSDADMQRNAMKSILLRAVDIVTGSRNKAYGTPSDNHNCTGEMWTAYLNRCGLLREGARITGKHVALMMCALKLSRDAHWEQEDNFLDIIGYAANAHACMLADNKGEDSECQPTQNLSNR